MSESERRAYLLEDERIRLRQRIVELEQQLAASQAEVAVLRKALEWYADTTNQTPRWLDSEFDGEKGRPPLFAIPYHLDMGMRAHAALATPGKKVGGKP